MGKEEVAQALEAMTKDLDVAERLAAGDFADLPDAELTETERAMVIAAADDIPDVSGFAVFAKYDGIDGESSKFYDEVEIHLQSPFGRAIKYSQLDTRVFKF